MIVVIANRNSAVAAGQWVSAQSNPRSDRLRPDSALRTGRNGHNALQFVICAEHLI
jgi:hypothetical protein